jgi:hypothetical protein
MRGFVTCRVGSLGFTAANGMQTASFDLHLGGD